jgi:cysteine desulfurase
MHIDLLSISGHKIYAPKGVGALYIRKKPRVRLHPLMSGGGQESGFRSGTLAPALCVGLGEAARLALHEMESDKEHVTKLSNSLLSRLQQLGGIVVNGDLENRYPGNLNVSFEDIDGTALFASL